jgi:hypothetical protein
MNGLSRRFWGRAGRVLADRPSSALLETLRKMNESRTFHLFEQNAQNKNLIFFVGAGLSTPFGFPTWTQFLRALGSEAHLINEIEGLINTGEYEQAAESLCNTLSMAFENRVKTTFGEHIVLDMRTSSAVSYLPKLVDGPIITTNFDHVIEEVFKESGRMIEKRYWGKQIAHWSDTSFLKTFCLIKLHGDAEDLSDRVLTRSEYDEYYGIEPFDPNKLHAKVLLEVFQSRMVLFVGCSLVQDRIMKILAHCAGTTLRNTSKRHIAIVEKPTAIEQYEERKRMLEGMAILPLWYTEGDHKAVETLFQHVARKAAPEVAPGRWIQKVGLTVLVGVLLVALGIMTRRALASGPAAAKFFSNLGNAQVKHDYGRAIVLTIPYKIDPQDIRRLGGTENVSAFMQVIPEVNGKPDALEPHDPVKLELDGSSKDIEIDGLPQGVAEIGFKACLLLSQPGSETKVPSPCPIVLHESLSGPREHVQSLTWKAIGTDSIQVDIGYVYAGSRGVYDVVLNVLAIDNLGNRSSLVTRPVSASEYVQQPRVNVKVLDPSNIREVRASFTKSGTTFLPVREVRSSAGFFRCPDPTYSDEQCPASP